MTRYRLTIEVYSDRDPSDLLDELIAWEMDETEPDESSACVEDLGYTKLSAAEQITDDWNKERARRLDLLGPKPSADGEDWHAPEVGHWGE